MKMIVLSELSPFYGEKREYELLMHLSEHGYDYFLIEEELGGITPWPGTTIHYTSPNYDKESHLEGLYAWIGKEQIKEILPPQTLKNNHFAYKLEDSQPF